MTHDYHRPAALLTHPLMVGALLTLIGNDHYLKVRHGGLITGKLSDIAGLVLFPVLVVSVIEAAAWLLRIDLPDRAAVLAVATVVTATGFTLIQLMPAAAESYRAAVNLTWFGPASVTPDRADLLMLPAVATGTWLLVYRRRRATSTVADGPQSSATSRTTRTAPLST